MLPAPTSLIRTGADDEILKCFSPFIGQSVKVAPSFFEKSLVRKPRYYFDDLLTSSRVIAPGLQESVEVKRVVLHLSEDVENAPCQLIHFVPHYPFRAAQ